MKGFGVSESSYVFRNEDSDFEDELSDSEIDKIVIFTHKSNVPTQLQPQPGVATSRPLKHDGHDRTGDWVTRTKMTQELAKVINDGLQYYEEKMWTEGDGESIAPNKSNSYRTVSIISKEDFEKVAPPLPKANNPEFPPAPPAPLNTPTMNAQQQVSFRFFNSKYAEGVH